MSKPTARPLSASPHTLREAASPSIGVLGDTWNIFLRNSLLPRQGLAAASAPPSYITNTIGMSTPDEIVDRLSSRLASFVERRRRPWFVERWRRPLAASTNLASTSGASFTPKPSGNAYGTKVSKS
jgi:hypothetical protein